MYFASKYSLTSTSGLVITMASLLMTGLLRADEHVTLDAKISGWQPPNIPLAANSAYVVLPDPASRYKLTPNGENDFHGTADMDGAELQVPGMLRLGGLGVLVWHHRANADAIPEIICFPPGVQYAFVRVGPNGGSISFLIADKKDTYGDNSGVLKVSVIKDDGTGVAIKCALPLVAERGASHWEISQSGAVKGRITYTVGSGSGSKQYSSGLVVEFTDGSIYHAELTKTVGRPFTGTRNGDHEEDRPSIPGDKLASIRRVYVNDAVDKGPSTVEEWAKTVTQWVKDADKEYRDLKNTALCQDAVKLIRVGN